ncbi:MAG TPA: PadR family transcriptional regulator [Clostridiales bacterium]|nr:PadR family transcriptional regulator [Clostridiales bacterium]
MESQQEIMGGLVQELHRGSLVLIILSQLNEKQYGYSLVQRLEEQGLSLDPGTLYPLLRRLEKQGLLDSQWDTEAGRPRRYYILSLAGRQVLTAVTREWRKLNGIMQDMLPGNSGGEEDGTD